LETLTWRGTFPLNKTLTLPHSSRTPGLGQSPKDERPTGAQAVRRLSTSRLRGT